MARFTQVDHDDRVALVALVGGAIVGVVRYDRLGVGAHEAEVAFVVRDDFQGYGLGSVLLEHLAGVARERGVRRFVAEVLPANHRMLGVFRDAGYASVTAVEDGVVRLDLEIEPTATSRAVTESREHRAESRSIERLLAPTSVAVIGASRDADSVGSTLLRNLVDSGFTGLAYAINPHASEAVQGVATYASVTDVPGPVDLAVVASPADTLLEVVADCAAKGVHALVVVSGGFAETGAEGRERQRLLVQAAHAAGMRVVGPNCLGFINTDPALLLNASLSPVMPGRGRIGFFSQSGALGIALLETLVRRGLGVSTFVSAGNRADVSGNDLMQFWEEDEATDVLLLYLESIGNPRKFSRIARRTSRAKPIVAVKSGRSSQGIPLGHRVRSTTLPPSAVDEMFRQSGVIQVDTLAALFDVAMVLTFQPLPVGRRVRVFGNSDALAVLAADACAGSAPAAQRRDAGAAAERLGGGLRRGPRRGRRRPGRRLRGRAVRATDQRLRRGLRPADLRGVPPRDEADRGHGPRRRGDERAPPPREPGRAADPRLGADLRRRRGRGAGARRGHRLRRVAAAPGRRASPSSSTWTATVRARSSTGSWRPSPTAARWAVPSSPSCCAATASTCGRPCPCTPSRRRWPRPRGSATRW